MTPRFFVVGDRNCAWLSSRITLISRGVEPSFEAEGLTITPLKRALRLCNSRPGASPG